VAVVLACDLAVVATRVVAPKVRPKVVRYHLVPATTTTKLLPAQPAGQAAVSGTASVVVADDAQSDPVAAPFTIKAERGRGSATIANAIVSGARATIVWNSGTPLPISGDNGSLDLRPAHVMVDVGGVTWTVDGGPRSFAPGRYHVGAPVAVGRGKGLASPRESVDFTADATTTLTSTGGATIHLDPTPIELDGPGRVTVNGSFEVKTGSRARSATSLTFGPGAYKLMLAPDQAGLLVDAILNGPLQVG
jgi:hypothetical protein